MAFNVQVAEEAYVGLESAVAYIARILCEPSAATKLLDSFDEFIDTVAALPELYPLCVEDRLASQGLRKALVEGYITLYMIEGKTVYVIGFFHQTQDYAKLV